ncbi:PDDEXK-like family protein [Bifidobacterium apri]|uniref:PD-(D/E)XK nuclease superfamily n=1 Tax=Bifidobacterium apri TaxID=1769423 RepID=A0A6A2V8L9_9BIFI|nr:PD-(D/E)XK nuclease family protein [Bifidobacterium apri]KAB8298547.1 PD-(D/E)XK nuclease superfamily [Bifidobacterium apri]
MSGSETKNLQTALKQFASAIDVHNLESALAAEHVSTHVFDVLGVASREVPNCRMLAWLMDPHGPHGLGGRVLNGVLGYLRAHTTCCIGGAIPDTLDMADFAVHTEVDTCGARNEDDGDGRMDIVAENRIARIAFIWEVKILSDEHDNQLNRYEEAAGSLYPGWTCVFVYLTRRGDTPGDKDWIALSWLDVAGIIEKARNDAGSQVPDYAGLVIDDYVATVRRRIVEETETKNLAYEVYREHWEALNFIEGAVKDEPCRLLRDAGIRWVKDVGLDLLDNIKESKKKSIRWSTPDLVDKFGKPTESEWGTDWAWNWEVILDGAPQQHAVRPRMGIAFKNTSHRMPQERFDSVKMFLEAFGQSHADRKDDYVGYWVYGDVFMLGRDDPAIFSDWLDHQWCKLQKCATCGLRKLVVR